MLRRASLVLATAAALASCDRAPSPAPSPSPSTKGPVVAKGDDIAITADEFRASLEQQSPLIRARFGTLERKREFLDNMIRSELLAKAAEKAGFANDPDVQRTFKQALVSKYYQKHFQDPDAGKNVPDAEVKKYYDEHPDEFHAPLRIHAAQIFLRAEAGGPDRVKKAGEAKKLLARLQAEEKKSPTAFAAIARASSEDAATKPMGGDLSFKSRDELEKGYGKELAAAAFALKDNETARSIVESQQGFHLVHVYGRKAEVARAFEEVKPELASRLAAQRRTKDFEDLIKKLRDDAKITIDDAALERVSVSGSPAAPGAPEQPGAAAPVDPASRPMPAAPR